MQCKKRIQIEKILSTAFYAANYAGLNEPLRQNKVCKIDRHEVVGKFLLKVIENSSIFN